MDSEENKPEDGEYLVVTPEEKRAHVNAMVRKVYDLVHENGEQMSIEEMILGYTINGARQLGIEARKGSIEAGSQ